MLSQSSPGNVPANWTTRPSSADGTASRMMGQPISAGGSCAAPSDGPKKTRSHSRVAYHPVTATVASPASRTTTATQRGAGPACRTASHAPARIWSLLKNPDSGGSPASAPSPIVIDQNVTGIAARSPPIRVIRLLPTAWMTAPAARNSSALNAAWVSRWNSAAAGTPTASPPAM